MKISSSPRHFSIDLRGGRSYKLIRTLSLVLLFLQALPALAQKQVSVVITGLAGTELANVQASLAIAQYRQADKLNVELVNELHGRAEQDIRRALQPFGYYKPKITATLTQAGAPWQASYHIDAGNRVPITNIDIQLSGAGSKDDTLAQVANNFLPGDPPVLDHLRYEAAKRELLKQLIAKGYLDARYELHRVEVNLERYTAQIKLQLNTGPRFVYGPITFDQQGFGFSTDYLKQYLILQPGEPVNQAQVSRQRTAFSKSGHFQEVSIDIDNRESTADAQTAVPLQIRLTPFKANRYRARTGWGTDTGFGLQADWNRRYLGRRGHHFNLGGTVVQERQRLAGELNYIIPFDPLTGKQLELSARHESKDLTFEDVDLDEGGETRIATNLLSTYMHFPRSELGGFELKQQAGLSLVNETYDVFQVLFGNLPSSSQDAIIDNIGSKAFDTLAPDFSAIVPSVRFTVRRTDNPLYIRRGDYFNLELLGADESLGSNISFLQFRLNAWNIFPMGDNSRLLLRSALGYTDVESREALGVTFNQMPEYYEFRAGGARSVRGYGFESLFPGDGITGGKHLAVASVEYERQIIPDWSAAVFVDGGNAFNDVDNIDEKIGVGFGVRWRSPFGLARVDIGFPLDEAEDSFQIYITVGPEF